MCVCVCVCGRSSFHITRSTFHITHFSLQCVTSLKVPTFVYTVPRALLSQHPRTASIFFYSLLFRDASTSLVISRLGSLGVYQKAVYFYCCVVNVSIVKFTDFNFMIIWIWWIMVKCIVIMKIQPSICLDDWGKPRKNPKQVGRHRDSNPEPSECESRALPRSHLARYRFNVNIHTVEIWQHLLSLLFIQFIISSLDCGMNWQCC